MGRPLNKKYFANTNVAVDGEGVGGEGVASVAIASPIAKSYTGAATATFSAPQIAGGQTATGTVTIDGNGDIAGVTVTNAGSGYTSVPTITVAEGGQSDTVLTSGSGGVTVTLSTSRQNGITCQAITAGSTNRTSGNDIIKQVGSKRFRVASVDGTAVCKLKASTPTAAGEMAIVATDSASGTYFVTKITAHKCVVTQGTGTQFETGAVVPWTFGSATVNVSVKIPNA